MVGTRGGRIRPQRGYSGRQGRWRVKVNLPLRTLESTIGINRSILSFFLGFGCRGVAFLLEADYDDTNTASLSKTILEKLLGRIYGNKRNTEESSEGAFTPHRMRTWWAERRFTRRWLPPTMTLQSSYFSASAFLADASERKATRTSPTVLQLRQRKGRATASKA